MPWAVSLHVVPLVVSAAKLSSLVGMWVNVCVCICVCACVRACVVLGFSRVATASVSTYCSLVAEL
jgi:hypothetical protein